ncbi:MAG: YkgJ family cysteine cluster protein [Candidatus Micrarchaeota archaeon]
MTVSYTTKSSSCHPFCLRCGNCCTRFGVCVTPFDIERIKKETGLKPEEFLDIVPDFPNRERKEPAILIDGKPFILVLKRKRKQDEICNFYSEDGQGCMIYDSRPMLCRTYPFIVRNNKLLDVNSRACVECWYPGSPDKEQYLVDLKIYGRNISKYKKIAEKWNKKGGGSFKEFLRFISKDK